MENEYKETTVVGVRESFIALLVAQPQSVGEIDPSSVSTFNPDEPDAFIVGDSNGEHAYVIRISRAT